MISLEVDDDVIIERMSGRRVCDKCGASYHVVYNPSADQKTCDKDGTPLTLRRDDQPEVVKDRLDTYHTQTEPIKDYYAETGKLKLIAGHEGVDKITALVFGVIDGQGQ